MTAHDVHRMDRRGTVTWRRQGFPVVVRFSSLHPEPSGRLDCTVDFPIGIGLPLRLDDDRTTLVVIVAPGNQFMAVRPLE